MMNFCDYIQGQDHILTFPWMGSMAVQVTGYKVYDIYCSPKRQLETAIFMDELFGADFVFPLDDGCVLEEAIGAKFDRPEYEFPSGGSPIVFDLKSLRELSIPDPYVDKRMSTNLETYRLLSDYFEKPLAISVPGPVTLAASLLGLEPFLRATVKQPEIITELMKFSTETVKRYCRASVSSGVRVLCISEPYASLLSPKMYKKLCSKNVKEVFDGLECFTLFHPCGNSTKYVECLLETGAQGYSLDQVVDLKMLAREFPKSVVIMGNLDPLEVLRNKESGDVREATNQLLDDMEDFPNYAFSFGCDCTSDTPIENLKIAISTAKNRKRNNKGESQK